MHENKNRYRLGLSGSDLKKSDLKKSAMSFGSTQPNLNTNSQGFTLVELMVALVVAGILLAVSIPLITSSIKNSRLTGAVNEFVSAIHLARSEASKRGGVVIICRADDSETDLPTCGTGESWRDGWVVFADDPTGAGVNLGTLDDGDDIVAINGPQDDTLLVNSNDNAIATQIAFLPAGFADLPVNLGQRYIVYCDAEEGAKFNRTITISNLGRPQVVDGSATYHNPPNCGS